jgi:HTH-type transcriptional regulator / antitoxin HigA
MSIVQTTLSIAKVQRAWLSMDAMVSIRPITNQREYARANTHLDALLAAAGDDEEHPLSGLIELLAENISRYEKRSVRIAPAAPHEVLQGLMDARGLTQKALQSVVQQSNLSVILAGKRRISATLAGKFGAFFDVNPGVFVVREVA